MFVGQNIKIKRIEKGISTTQLSKKIGVNQSTIVRYENGQVRRISDDTLLKIADCLECSVNELIGDDPKYTTVPKSKKKVYSKAFSEEEQELIFRYRQLPALAQKIIREICDLQLSLNK
jgi:transcriptional regulator with XRE-family HTH domain